MLLFDFSRKFDSFVYAYEIVCCLRFIAQVKLAAKGFDSGLHAIAFTLMSMTDFHDIFNSAIAKKGENQLIQLIQSS